ncbi:MAG: 3-phosphoshikimate 1-carboxyvinyltransferase [Candidatus Ancaeobacter aquaticus]|nr:3-phosphoshikimate 1-carboxyvinyltransferase [Candidatus Ancaeobacter aquaticus]
MSHKITVSKAKSVQGVITVPGDKSVSHRAALLSAMATGTTRISGYLTSGDCIHTLKALTELGVSIEGIGTTDVTVCGVGLDGFIMPKRILDCGNSGTGMRLLSGLLAGQHFTTAITGDESLQKRPMKRIIDPLGQMGAIIEGLDGTAYPPLSIRGAALKGITYHMPVASAQVKSAILIAGICAEGKTTVIEKVKSRDHTERMMHYLGIPIDVEGMKITVVGQKQYNAKDIDVPGDISSAAFMIVAALIVPGSELVIKNVCLNPTRTGIISVLRRMGAQIDIHIKETIHTIEPVGDITVRYSDLVSTEISGDEIPNVIDELPIIAIAAAHAQGKTIIKDARELRVKETDRITAVCTNLKLMGVDVREFDDGFEVVGGENFQGGSFESFDDHRIAMSMIIGGLATDEPTTVHNTDCIDTSFPGFKDLVQRITV